MLNVCAVCVLGPKVYDQNWIHPMIKMNADDIDQYKQAVPISHSTGGESTSCTIK